MVQKKKKKKEEKKKREKKKEKNKNNYCKKCSRNSFIGPSLEYAPFHVHKT
jgi:ribosomal protein S19